MRNKEDGGFTLIEILFAIVLLSALVIPTLGGLVMAAEMNARTDALTQAQLAVSSVTETLMAKGIDEDFLKGLKVPESVPQEVSEKFSNVKVSDDYPKVFFVAEKKTGFCKLQVISADGLVDITTSIRTVPEGGAQ